MHEENDANLEGSIGDLAELELGSDDESQNEEDVQGIPEAESVEHEVII